MSAYERQLLVKYHRADLLSQAHEARLARAASAAGRAPTERVTAVSLMGPLSSILTAAAAWLHARISATRRAAAIPPAPTIHVMLRSTHLR